MSFWDTKEFKKLKKEWYDRLSEEGFRDIELNDKSLNTSTAKFSDMEAIREYYLQVSEYLHTGEFKNSREKAIWFLYSEGYSVRDVARSMNLNRKLVTKVVEAHITRMEKNRHSDE